MRDISSASSVSGEASHASSTLRREPSALFVKIEQLPTKIPQTASLPGVTWSFLWWARKAPWEEVKDSPPLPSKPRLCSGIPSKKLQVKTFVWKRKVQKEKEERVGEGLELCF